MYKFLLLNTLMILWSVSTVAQCNPEDWVESFYNLGKDIEKIAFDFFPISDADEEIIGDSLHLKMVEKGNIADQHPQQVVLQRILRKLTPYVKRKGIKYDIHILADKKIPNAFSIAGGHLYVTEKLIDWVESENELAFVIAHEVGHVDGKHSISKVQKLLLSDAVLSERYGADYARMAGNFALVLTSPFGQIDEYEADRLGASIAVKAGYNPRDGLRFFERMSTKESKNVIEKIIRTHPYSSERHNCLDEFLRVQLKK